MASYVDDEDRALNETPVEEETNAEQTDEEYAFVRETVRPRPLRFRTILLRLFLIVLSAAIFGAVAGFVFYELQLRREAAEGQAPVTIETDTPDTPTPTPTPTPEVTVTPTPVPTPEVTPTPEEPEEEPAEKELTPEERRALTLEEIAHINTALKSVAKDASAHLATLQFTATQEDGAENTQQTSGVFIADNGTTLFLLADSTNIGTAEGITATCADGETYPVTFQAADPITALAVYTMPKESLAEGGADRIKVAPLGNSYQLESGDFLIAVGEPYGHAGAFLYGTLHAAEDRLGVIDGEYRMLLTDMDAQSTSNGMLLNSKGELVGVIAQRFAAEGSSHIVALPISLIKDVIEKMSNNLPIPYIGITGADVPEERDDMPKGVYVETVEANSPAMAAGIQPGDVITKIDELDVPTLRAYRSALMQKTAGDSCTLSIERPGADGYVPFEFTTTIAALS